MRSRQGRSGVEWKAARARLSTLPGLAEPDLGRSLARVASLLLSSALLSGVQSTRARPGHAAALRRDLVKAWSSPKLQFRRNLMLGNQLKAAQVLAASTQQGQVSFCGKDRAMSIPGPSKPRGNMKCAWTTLLTKMIPDQQLPVCVDALLANSRSSFPTNHQTHGFKMLQSSGASSS